MPYRHLPLSAPTASEAAHPGQSSHGRRTHVARTWHRRTRLILRSHGAHARAARIAHTHISSARAAHARAIRVGKSRACSHDTRRARHVHRTCTAHARVQRTPAPVLAQRAPEHTHAHVRSRSAARPAARAGRLLSVGGRQREDHLNSARLVQLVVTLRRDVVYVASPTCRLRMKRRGRAVYERYVVGVLQHHGESKPRTVSQPYRNHSIVVITRAITCAS